MAANEKELVAREREYRMDALAARMEVGRAYTFAGMYQIAGLLFAGDLDALMGAMCATYRLVREPLPTGVWYSLPDPISWTPKARDSRGVSFRGGNRARETRGGGLAGIVVKIGGHDTVTLLCEDDRERTFRADDLALD